jgi:hypothetical protein
MRRRSPKVHRFLMNFTFDEIKTQLHRCISYISPERDTIIIENSPSDVGYYSKSDIVMLFNPQGLMILCTERISASVGALEFFFCKLKSFFIKDKPDDSIDTVITRGKGYVDVTLIHEDHRIYIAMMNIKIDYNRIGEEVRAGIGDYKCEREEQ